MISKIQTQVEQKLQKSFIDMTATHFRRQVVAGMIYHIRVLASESSDDEEAPPKLSVLHLRVFHPLFDEPLKLQAVKAANPSETLEVLDVDPSLL